MALAAVPAWIARYSVRRLAKPGAAPLVVPTLCTDGTTVRIRVQAAEE